MRESRPNDFLDRKRLGFTRAEIYKVIGDSCALCGMTNSEHKVAFGKSITIHHLDGKGRHSTDPNNIPSNLQILCLPCHGKIDSVRGVRVRRERRDAGFVQLYKRGYTLNLTPEQRIARSLRMVEARAKRKAKAMRDKLFQAAQRKAMAEAIEKHLPALKQMAEQVIHPTDNTFSRMVRDFEQALRSEEGSI